MEVVKERKRGTTNGIMHAFERVPDGRGGVDRRAFMAAGNWAMPYGLAGAVYALAFVVF